MLFARILESPPEPGQDVSRLRVRVSNSADATRTDFTLGWTGDAQTDGTASEGDDLKRSAEFPVQVPPGQSRVIRMPAPGPGITTLLLRGDRQEFDNRHFVVTVEPRPASLIHLGSIVGEPRDNLLFYLQRIPFNNPRRVVTVEAVEPDQFVACLIQTKFRWWWLPRSWRQRRRNKSKPIVNLVDGS